jgi:hypothetical protein
VAGFVVSPFSCLSESFFNASKSTSLNGELRAVVVPKVRNERSGGVVTIVKRPAAVKMGANVAVLQGMIGREYIQAVEDGADGRIAWLSCGTFGDR